MKVQLISKPNIDALMLCGFASSICVSEDPDRITDSTCYRSLRSALSSGHDSVLEHATYSFLVTGISRACSHQLVRHRLASYAQQSQRYVRMPGCFEYVIPPEIEKDRILKAKYDNAMQNIQRLYDDMIEIGYLAPEDARYILPNACCTNILITMNARELSHFLSLRCCNRAQWEIRELALKMLEICIDEAPLIFSDAGPACNRGKCPEGRRSCGKPWRNENDEHDESA